MKWLRTFTSRLDGFFSKQRIERDLDAEGSVHLDMLIAENIRRAWRPRQRAMPPKREFGGVEQAKKSIASSGPAAARRLVRDNRFAHPHVGQAARA